MLTPRHAMADLFFPDLLAVAAASFVSGIANTLERNGRWTVTKTSLEKGVMGAEEYVRDPRTLAGGELNPGRWHGYPEVPRPEPVRPDSFARRARLAFVILEDDRNDRLRKEYDRISAEWVQPEIRAARGFESAAPLDSEEDGP